MARKKTARKKTVARRKKSASKRSPARRKKTKRAAKPVRGKAAARRKKPAAKRPAPPPAKRKRVAVVPRGKPAGAAKRVRRDAAFDVGEPLDERGLGPESGGQSGDTEGLSRDELADSESVAELLEEGQAFEAGVVSGVENAPDADRGPVRTRQVPEDDVPEEYFNRD
jgi:hypothetical protein